MDLLTGIDKAAVDVLPDVDVIAFRFPQLRLYCTVKHENTGVRVCIRAWQFGRATLDRCWIAYVRTQGYSGSIWFIM